MLLAREWAYLERGLPVPEPGDHDVAVALRHKYPRRVLIGLGLGALVVSACAGREEPSENEDPSVAPGVEPVGDSGDSTDESDESSQSNDESNTMTLPVDKPSEEPVDPTGCPDEEPYDFSLIWIANSPEGTVSKIDTRTAKELARYRTGPTVESNPSRTAVSLQGFVAVANRKGSVAVIAPHLGKCVDRNGDGKITTSSSGSEVLEWGEDECVLWHKDLEVETKGGANTGGPRAVAWGLTPGGKDPCGDEKADLWVGYLDSPKDEVLIKKLSAKGEILDEARVVDWKSNWGHGLYGGAIDPKGNFWGLGTKGTLLRVNPDTMDVDRFEYEGGEEQIPYGISVDGAGRVWTAGHKNGQLVYFDPKDETFHKVEAADENSRRYRGLAVTQDQQVWVAVNGDCGLAHYDAKKKVWVDALIALPECSQPVGVGVDPQGKVWVVDKGADRAYRLDPKDKSVQQVQGLTEPYSYSDMTGAGLRLVDDPPPV